MHTLLCTGNGGGGSAVVAVATASAAASSGTRTLLASAGPSHSLQALLGTAPGMAPQTVAPNLDVWACDVRSSLSALSEELRPRLPGTLAQLSGDELPLVPGIDLFICLERLRTLTPASYDLLVLDVGAHDMLLRVLSMPDSFRWGVRLLFGLDRGPGQNPASLGRALLPTSLLPYEWVNQVQDARVQLEQMRDKITASERTTVRYVLRPDAAALDEARLAVPALYLHGLVVDALVVGPLLPADSADTRLKPVIAQQQAVAHEAEQAWGSLPIMRLPLNQPGDAAAFAALGQALYAGRRPDRLDDALPPITYTEGAEPALVINLPGIPRGALHLTMSGDELIVQVGAYRRHVLLPAALRGKSTIKASREGEKLVVRLRR